MNERIKELAEQAEFYAWEELAKVPGPVEMAISKRVFDGSFRLKFAELIVGECVDIIEKLPPGYKDYRDQIEDAFRRACVKEIRQQLGVEQ